MRYDIFIIIIEVVRLLASCNVAINFPSSSSLFCSLLIFLNIINYIIIVIVKIRMEVITVLYCSELYFIVEISL